MTGINSDRIDVNVVGHKSNFYPAKEIKFSSAFVCLSAGLWKNYTAGFHKAQWNGGRGRQKMVVIQSPDHVMLGVGSG